LNIEPSAPSYDWRGAGGITSDAALVGSSSPMTREQQFLSQLPEIESVIRWVCARRRLYGADAEDFASAVKYRLIENDYEVLAKFQGRCSLRTFLTVVVGRLYLDFQVRRFGKWRNSAVARRLGPVATRLERLMHRDNLTFDEACEVLASDARATESRDALYAIAVQLPRRSRSEREPAPTESRDEFAAGSGVERNERQALAHRTFGAIRSSLAMLPGAARLFLRLHLVEGLTIAQVSRALGLDQKALYKKKDALFRRLRADVEGAGIGPAEARELLSKLDWEVALFDDVAPGDVGAGEQVGPCPSPSLTDADRREGEW
jgi:RNA polymerase sigma factor (sigma-70 family)